MANIKISTFTRNNDSNTYVIKDANAMPKTTALESLIEELEKGKEQGASK